MGPPRERGGERPLGKQARPHHMCFNGAAARTRRRERSQSESCARVAMLQWGRRANAAESAIRQIGAADAERLRLLGLQWGRRANAAESTAPSGTTTTVAKLQWGRRANAAERRSVAGPVARGAAASMGPPRERGGEFDLQRCPVSVAHASMGPPRERGGEVGNLSNVSGTKACFNGAAARTRRRGAPCRKLTRPARRFNGAAARTRRRVRLRVNGRPPEDLASMGPPRERGGERGEP